MMEAPARRHADCDENQLLALGVEEIIDEPGGFVPPQEQAGIGCPDQTRLVQDGDVLSVGHNLMPSMKLIMDRRGTQRVVLCCKRDVIFFQ
jgi:hypothetical protein